MYLMIPSRVSHVRFSPGNEGYRPLQALDPAERLKVVLEAAVPGHHFVEHLFARMAEGRMTEVVSQRHGLGKLFVQSERPADRAGDLTHLKGMGQAGTVVIALMVDEYLCLVLEAPEGCGVNDPIAVPLKGGAHPMLGLGVGPARLSALLAAYGARISDSRRSLSSRRPAILNPHAGLTPSALRPSGLNPPWREACLRAKRQTGK